MVTAAKPLAPPYDEWLDSDPPLETHRANSERLRRRSAKSLSEGERLSSSEEIWGAAAQGVKAIARRRGWPHHSHDALRVIANYLGKLVDDDNIGPLFSDLESLHRNFYDDRLSVQQIETARRRLSRFKALLRDADGAIPDGVAPPDDPEYERRARAYLRKWHRRAPARPGASASGG